VSARENIHATGLVVDGVGLLQRGPSGAGKSRLALELIEDARWRGRPALLVGDDRIELEAVAGRLLMHGPETLLGRIELRGRGIVRRPFARTAPLHLVVDLVARLERMPEAAEFATALCGVPLARCPVPRAGVVDLRHQLLLVREALDARAPARQERQKIT
jgi:serine kinase of HPr protein (carbohydrate metabolism regulator)